MRFWFFLIFLSIRISLNAQEVIDKIAAVVGDEIITQSELEFQVNLYAAQRKIDPSTPGLKNQVLNTLIEEKLVYAQANMDSITVSDDEVKSRIDYQLEVFKQQYGSLSKVEEVYGMSIEKIRRELQDGVRKNIMVQKLQEKNFSDIECSRREVEDFFNNFKDSLGIIPEKVQIAHIFRNPRKSETVKLKYKKFAEEILDSIKAGADFAAMAKKYSEDPGSASQGGDLGFVKRGVFYPEFESVAFALKDGEISGVVESPVGFHIIQLIERRGESIHTRHILIKIKNDEESDLQTIQFLSDLRDSIVKSKGTFGYFAKKYSEDDDTKKFGGELGTFYINQLDKSFLDAVAKLKENEISFPRRFEYSADNYGYHIVYLEKRIPQHKADLKLDYDEMKRLADEYKKQKLYEKWIAELKNNIFWEVRI
ncbi:MAG TPA: peptidylprolyl isomerase [Ignavibacteriaceae bacterium]|nr:peptidylprolyl isomerase [Ignavibacteriaceae bacterium]